MNWFKRLKAYYFEVLDEVHELDKIPPPYHYDPREKELTKGDTDDEC